MILTWITKLVELSNKSKLANWASHGVAVAAFGALGWVLSGPILAHLASHGDGVIAGVRALVDVGTIVYFWREAETVFGKFVATGKIKVMEDNLGDLVGPIIVMLAAHLA